MDSLEKMQRVEFEVGRAESGRRLDQCLAARLKDTGSRNHIQSLVLERGVWVNGGVVKQKNYSVKEGDLIRLEWPVQKPFELTGEKIPVPILYEDTDLLVVDKPIGLVVHPGAGRKTGTLVNALIGTGRKLSEGEAGRPGIVHRIDKDTSGILIVAKTENAHQKLAKLFAEREVAKTYAVVIWGQAPHQEGRLSRNIGRDPQHPTRMKTRVEGEGKEAITEYVALERFRNSTFLEVRLITGRTHQIRVHFASEGHPVLGDRLYGKSDGCPRLALHAWKIAFRHPRTGKEIKVEAPLPSDFVEILAKQRAVKA